MTSQDVFSKYKEEILKEMEKNGTINNMKARVKSQIIEQIKNQKKEAKKKLEFEFLTPFQRIAKGKDLMMLTHLIIEFLQFYEMEYTLPIFLAEANINEKVKAETLVKDANLRGDYDNNQPILLQMVSSFLEEKPRNMSNRLFDDPFYKKDKEINYSSGGLGLLSGGLSGLSSYNKNSFGSLNKSTDANTNINSGLSNSFSGKTEPGKIFFYFQIKVKSSSQSVSEAQNHLQMKNQ